MGETLPKCEFESRNLILKLQKTLEGRIEKVPPFVEGIMEIVTSMGCAAGKEKEVEIALLEALANAVQHGCKNDPSKRVEDCVALCVIVDRIRDPGGIRSDVDSSPTSDTLPVLRAGHFSH
jgi:anti-sigma regulatory factor (Ser/Thr protein kinase)